MELTRYISLVRRWWWLLVLGTLICGIASFGISKTLTPIYRSTATLLVNQTQVPGTIAYNDILTSQRLTSTYKELIEERPVLQSVIDRLNLPLTREQLASKMTVSVVTDTQLLRLSVEDSDPALTSSIANTAAAAFIEENTQNKLSRPGDVSIVEAATTPTTPVKPNIKINTALAAFVGLLLAGGIALLIEYLDDTIKSPDDLEAVGLPSLGGVARFHQLKDPADNLIAGSLSRRHFAEAYRVLRTNVQFSTIDRPGQTLLVTSANPREGKSTTAANLALVTAQAGKRVILVDSDLRRPSIHRFFGLNNEQGLTNLLLTPQPTINGYLQRTRFENLSVVTSGPLPPNPSELLASRRLDSVLDALRSQADVVIIDSPPTLPVADASILASKVDGTMLVVDTSKTRMQALRRTREALDRSKTHLLGAVLNKLKRRTGGYYYYYHYYTPDGEKKERRRKKAEAKAA
ncbi:MAG: polysaccharide biosynthesis tyrosine autokinase [Dehalococcoidia bacterium]|jgi:receptor protein-tyrosine kinase